jgi:hypothetical protein
MRGTSMLALAFFPFEQSWMVAVPHQTNQARTQIVALRQDLGELK